MAYLDDAMKKVQAEMLRKMEEEMAKAMGIPPSMMDTPMTGTAQDYADFNGGRIDEVYERLEYVRQFMGSRQNPFKEAYPEL